MVHPDYVPSPRIEARSQRLALPCPVTDFEVVNSLGVLLYTSPELKFARRFARKNAATFPGLKVERVVRSEVRQRVYTPSLRLVEGVS